MPILLDLFDVVNSPDSTCPAGDGETWEDEYTAWATAHEPAISESEIEAMERFHQAFDRLLEESETP